MNPQELANYFGFKTIRELARRMIQEAMKLSKAAIFKENYTRRELGDLGRAVSRTLFDQQEGGPNEGRTYQRFWDGEQFENSKVLNRLCAYILHMQGEIEYKPGAEEPGTNHWFMYSRSVTGQPIHEPVKEDLLPAQTQYTRKYRAYFFSHIRYNVWENGTIEMRYKTEHSGTVSGKGFYRGLDDAFNGTFKIEGNHICMDLEGQTKKNWFRLIGKVDGDKMKDAEFFRAAYVTISSYAEQYTSAIEVMFLEEQYAADNPKEIQKIKRYLMLKRHRFQSDLWDHKALTVSPSNLEPNDLEKIPGIYVCVSRIYSQVLVSSLTIDGIYRTTFETEICRESNLDRNHQLCYLELMRAGALNYIHVKGYKATRNTDEPSLSHLVSTFTIPMLVNDANPIKGTFNSVVELNGKEILWAGECYLMKFDGKKAIKPFMCPVESLDQYLENIDDVLSGMIRDVISH